MRSLQVVCRLSLGLSLFRPFGATRDVESDGGYDGGYDGGDNGLADDEHGIYSSGGSDDDGGRFDPCEESRTPLERQRCLDLVHETEARESRERCDHGTWDEDAGKCICDPGFKTAGPTDTFSFLSGACTQSMCQSDDQCQLDLEGHYVNGTAVLHGDDTATCPHVGWNCYCGWKYAFAESFSGASNSKAKCMGVLYMMSVSGGVHISWFIRHSWKPLLFLAFLLLPFGQTHARCQHNNPDMYRMVHPILKRWMFRADRCRGARAAECICDGSCEHHPISDWWYTFAWSLYVIDFMIWLYCFLLITYGIAIFAWAVVMWLVVAMIITVACILGLLGAACGGGGNEAGGECVDCGDCAGGDGSCCQCEANCCDGCYGAGISDPVLFYLPGDFYIGGPGAGPNDCNCCDYSCGGCCEGCQAQKACRICRPFAWIISKFPNPPPNMLGGFLGYCLGTGPNGHYEGGNRFIDNWLSGRSRQPDITIHSNQEFRDRVADFIYSFSNEPAQADEVPRHANRADLETPLMTQAQAPNQFYGKLLLRTDDFDQDRDNIVASCFEDYKKNECWICSTCNHGRQDLPSDRQWHLWLTCGHMFCHQCSAEMSRRRMPCPLCRRTTNRIKEGPCFSQGDQDQPREPNPAVQQALQRPREVPSQTQVRRSEQAAQEAQNQAAQRVPQRVPQLRQSQREAVQALQGMGIVRDEATIIQALRNAHWDANRAAEQLLTEQLFRG